MKDYLGILKRAEAELAAQRQAAREAVYRAALLRAFALAEEDGTDPAIGAECADLVTRLAALVDDVGASRADAIRAEERARWRRETGRCPLCGAAAPEED